MSRRTRFLIKFVAILFVLVSVLLEMDVIKAPSIEAYKYWMSIIGFGMMLLVCR